MKGFKNTTRTRSGHTFSSGPREVGPYLRRSPMRKAVGGVVDTGSGNPVGNALTQRTPPISALDAVSGGKTPLRPGFKSGGSIGATKVAGTKAAKTVLEGHVNAPAPRGHKGLGKMLKKGC